MGADCSQIDCAFRVTEVDGFAPATGGVHPGQVINVYGRNLDCGTVFDCVWRDGINGDVLMRTTSSVINEFGMRCVVPAGLSSSLYHPSRYTDTPSSVLSGGVTTRVAPLGRITLDVVNASMPLAGQPGGAPAARSTEYALMLCQPPSAAQLSSATVVTSVVSGSRATLAAYFDFRAFPARGLPSPSSSPAPSAGPVGALCANEGICTLGGTCVCSPGFAGPLCGESADETSGNASAPLPASLTTAYSVYGSDTGSQTLHPALAVYQAIVESDWFGPAGSDTEGLLMAARDVTIGRYSVGERWLTPPHPRWDRWVPALGRTVPMRADLAVGRSLNYTSGAILSGGNIVYGSNDSSILRPAASLVAPGDFVLADPRFPFPGGADFDGAIIAMRWFSAALETLPRTGTTIHKFARVMTLTGTRPDVNVFHISAAELAEVDEVELVLTSLPRGLAPGARPRGSALPSVVINVMYERAWTSHGPGNGDRLSALFSSPAPALNVTLADLGLTGDFYYSDSIASRIVWNMPSATVVRAFRIEIVGTLLAPYAHIDFPTGEMHGQLLAQSFAGNGQINLPMYASASDPSLVAFIQASLAGVFTPEALTTLQINGTCTGSCGASTGGSPPSSGLAALPLNPFGGLDPQVSEVADKLLRWRTGGVPTETIRLLEDLLASPSDAMGWYGAPILPDCGPRGYHNTRGECVCWDPETYKGRECEIQCRDDFCNGRGVCNPANQSQCACFDPVRWEGDRCQLSTCGVNKRRISGPTPSSPTVCACAPGFSEDSTGACTVEISCQFGTVVGEKCQCTPGWSGTDCNVPFPEPIQCFHGRITESTVTVRVASGPTAGTSQAVTVHNCSCFEGWTGPACDVFSGRGSSFCYYGVFQNDTGFCKCDPLWAGPRCDVYTCLHGVAEQVRVSSDGSTAGPDSEVVAQTVTDGDGGIAATSANAGPDTLQCRCLDGWFGADCGTHCRAACNWRGTVCAAGVPPTTSSGVSATGASTATCTCDSGFTGSQCELSTFGIPTGLESAAATQVLSSSTNVSFSAGTNPAADQAAARMLAAAGRLRGGGAREASSVLARELQQVSSGVYGVTLKQTAGLWRSSRAQIVSGSSADVSQALALAGPGSVVGGGAAHRGEADELVNVFPVLVRVRRGKAAATGQSTTVSVKLPSSIKQQLSGTHVYAALASTTTSSGSGVSSTGCKSGAPAGSVVPAGSSGADAQYNWATGVVTAVVCQGGTYHVQLMQPSVVNRAFPPPSAALAPSPGPGPDPSGLAGWVIAVLVVGSLLVIVAVVVVVRRARMGPATTRRVSDSGEFDGAAPGGASEAAAVDVMRDRRAERRQHHQRTRRSVEDAVKVPVQGAEAGSSTAAATASEVNPHMAVAAAMADA